MHTHLSMMNDVPKLRDLTASLIAKTALNSLLVDKDRYAGLGEDYERLVQDAAGTPPVDRQLTARATYEVLKLYEDIITNTDVEDWDVKGFIGLIEYFHVEDQAAYFVIKQLFVGNRKMHNAQKKVIVFWGVVLKLFYF
jgi:hypothetical protein